MKFWRVVEPVASRSPSCETAVTLSPAVEASPADEIPPVNVEVAEEVLMSDPVIPKLVVVA